MECHDAVGRCAQGVGETGVDPTDGGFELLGRQAELVDVGPVEALRIVPHGGVAACAHGGDNRPDLGDRRFGREVRPRQEPAEAGRGTAKVEDLEHRREA